MNREIMEDIKRNIIKLKKNCDIRLVYPEYVLRQIFFEKQEEHFILKNDMKMFLKDFDLQKLSFENVDVRYTDFSQTNAFIDQNKVYLKSLEGCIMNIEEPKKTRR